MEFRLLCEELDNQGPQPSSQESHFGEQTNKAGCGGARERGREDMSSGGHNEGQGCPEEKKTNTAFRSPLNVHITANCKRSPDYMTCTNSRDVSYIVTWSVTIAIAIPKGEDSGQLKELILSVKKSKSVKSSRRLAALKALSYYHIEYNLLPGEQDPIKVDLVMFGPIAKIYMENETKVLKPWHEDGQVWLGWTQSVNVTVTRELLIKLVTHKFTLRIWDTKDRVCAKARYDRPKLFQLPQSRPGEDQDVGGIKSMVYKLRSGFDEDNPRTRYSKKRQDTECIDSKKFSEPHSATAETRRSTEGVTTSEKVSFSTASIRHPGPEVTDLEHCEARSVAEDLSSIDLKHDGQVEQESALSKPAQKKSTLDQFLNDTKETINSSSKTSISLMESVSVKEKKKASTKMALESPADTRHIRMDGVASGELSLVNFLAGDHCLTDHLVTYSSAVHQGFCSISLNRPLISEELKAELNPLVITILSASSLPSTPVPLSVLEGKCLPVYCQYQFHHMPLHRTKGHEHSTDVYFKDVNVILTGLLSPAELVEYLRGPPLKIEVHDRDRPFENANTSPALFGNSSNYDSLSSVVLVSGKPTSHNTFSGKSERYNPCGIAKLNLSDLLLGQHTLKVNLPILCSEQPTLLGRDCERLIAARPGNGAVDEAEQEAIPMGHYLDANSQLKVHVEIACPLKVESSDGESDCYFGRIIYMFKYTNVSVMSQLRSELLRINAGAFQLEDQSNETVERALSGYTLAALERERRDLDVVTGFHLLDKQIHLFVLEGIAHKAIRRLWDTVPMKLSGPEEDHVMVLYNSSLSFTKRLYDLLDISFTPVHLFQPLTTIMRQPLVYVRDMVPYTCFQAMSRLSILIQLRKLKEVVHNDLFPSAEMILSMKKELGEVHPGNWWQGLQDNGLLEANVSSNHDTEIKHCCLDTHNTPDQCWKQSMDSQQLNNLTKDFIQAKIAEVPQASVKLQKARPAVLVAPEEGRHTHNYSIQTRNDTELELPRHALAQSPDRTYSHQYHSATVHVQDADDERSDTHAQNRATRKTKESFIYPSFKSSIEANKHPRLPDEARREELRMPWKENVLHSNILRAPLPQRDIRPWIKDDGMELYIKPPAFFSTVQPFSIQLAGEILEREQQQCQYYRGLRKVLPDARHTSHRSRVPEFSCHMGAAGPGKMLGMLKDQPMKYSLRKPGLVLKPMPVLSVIQHPQLGPGSSGVETDESKSFAPGPYQNHRLSWDKNIIPRHASFYNKYHFKAFLKEKTFQYKRSAPPLTDVERRVSVFQHRSTPYDIRQTAESSQSQAARSIVETRTHTDVTLHIQ
ncbi:hypothetical protein UPYG_G00092710 [Umbra pygmaea]|uniref:DUF4550 domain-containing protein n=1 Tax=Umbra pygmaea TaxID=75934 RepID=A0ABD0XXJ0_UMBPY